MKPIQYLAGEKLPKAWLGIADWGDKCESRSFFRSLRKRVHAEFIKQGLTPNPSTLQIISNRIARTAPWQTGIKWGLTMRSKELRDG